jgi:hypothetical protein
MFLFLFIQYILACVIVYLNTLRIRYLRLSRVTVFVYFETTSLNIFNLN